MEVSAKLKHLRIAPRKVRLVADLIRLKDCSSAKAILKFTPKRATVPMLKLLNSAIANAKNNFQLDEKNLYISKLTVDEGPKLKRWRPRAMGRAYPIQKKTSHISLVLGEQKKESKKESEKELKKEPKKENKQEGPKNQNKSKIRTKARTKIKKDKK